MIKLTKTVIQGYTFIVPSLSVGNVPQLAVDLVIESLKMKKIGFAFHPGVVPVIGPCAFSHETETTSSCEVYVSESKKLVVLQLRAPVAVKQLQSFLDELLVFLSECEPKEVIVLGSCFSHERHDPALKRKLEYVGNASFLDSHAKELEEFVQHPDNKLPWQGFATKLYETMEGKLSVPVGVLFAYVSEGDNIPEAKDLALFLNRVVEVFVAPAHPSTIPIPVSWQLLFGNAAPLELFY